MVCNINQILESAFPKALHKKKTREKYEKRGGCARSDYCKHKEPHSMTKWAKNIP